MSERGPYSVDQLLGLLSARDIAVLRSIETFRLLSSRHIKRLHFTTGHVSDLSGMRIAVRVLDRLEQHGLIVRLARRVGGAQRGSSGLVWQLSATGERLLRAGRGDRRRRRFQEPSALFVEHQLAVSELAVRVTEATRDEGFDLLELATEPASWRSFVSSAGGVSWVKPDLALITADATTETHTWVEVDRNTEHLGVIRRKCALYQAYFQTGAEQIRRGVFPAVVWSVPDAHRAQNIRSVIDGDPQLDDRLFIVRIADDVLEVLAPPDVSGEPDRSGPNPKGGTP